MGWVGSRADGDVVGEGKEGEGYKDSMKFTMFSNQTGMDVSTSQIYTEHVLWTSK